MPEVLDRLAGGIEADGELLIRWHELLSEPGATDRIEVPLRTADGELRWARMDLVNHLDDDDPCLLRRGHRRHRTAGRPSSATSTWWPPTPG